MSVRQKRLRRWAVLGLSRLDRFNSTAHHDCISRDSRALASSPLPLYSRGEGPGVRGRGRGTLLLIPSPPTPLPRSTGGEGRRSCAVELRVRNQPDYALRKEAAGEVLPPRMPLTGPAKP